MYDMTCMIENLGIVFIELIVLWVTNEVTNP